MKRAASRELPPERRAAQLEREKQAKITGLQTPTQTEDRYPGWVLEVRKKSGANTPTPYQTPGDLRRGMTTDEQNDAIGIELGARDIIDPLASPTPRSSPDSSTIHGRRCGHPVHRPSSSVACYPCWEPTSGDKPRIPHAHHFNFNVCRQHPVVFEGTRICRQLDKGHPDVRSIFLGVGDSAPRTWTGSLPLCIWTRPDTTDHLRRRHALQSCSGRAWRPHPTGRRGPGLAISRIGFPEELLPSRHTHLGQDDAAAMTTTTNIFI